MNFGEVESVANDKPETAFAVSLIGIKYALPCGIRTHLSARQVTPVHAPVASARALMVWNHTISR
jgi:hypothetical protein